MKKYFFIFILFNYGCSILQPSSSRTTTSKDLSINAIPDFTLHEASIALRELQNSSVYVKDIMLIDSNGNASFKDTVKIGFLIAKGANFIGNGVPVDTTSGHGIPSPDTTIIPKDTIPVDTLPIPIEFRKYGAPTTNKSYPMGTYTIGNNSSFEDDYLFIVKGLEHIIDSLQDENDKLKAMVKKK